MAIIEDPDNVFRASYKDRRSYPVNLVFQYGNSSSLEDYRRRLDERGSSLFNSNDDAVIVPFREYDALGTLIKQNIFNDASLQTWLDDREKIITEPDILLGARSLPTGRHREPRCRFVFFVADHSWNPLNVTRDMFCRILSFHQVHPSYLNLCLSFGSEKNRPKDFRFSGFRAQTFLMNPRNALEIKSRGRSGLHFQISYNLRVIESSSAPDTAISDMVWARRQAAFHHQFDVVYGTSLWIVTSGRDSIKKRIQKLLPDRGPFEGIGETTRFATVADCLKTSLMVHLEYCYWSVAEWRWYMQWLETRIEDLTEAAIDLDAIKFSEVDLRMLQSYEDRVREAIMVLETNSEVMGSIRSFYEDLMGKISLPWVPECREAITQFSAQILEITYDLKMHISRGKVLITISDDRKQLVQQRMQASAVREMADLTMKMQRVTEEGKKEAVTMRIITVITLIYLPATFVSTFFSTDVVKYDGETQVFSSLAMSRWAAVTFPLTVITMLVAGWWIWYSGREQGQSQGFSWHHLRRGGDLEMRGTMNTNRTLSSNLEKAFYGRKRVSSA